MLPISEHRQAAPAFQQALCPSKQGDFSSRPRLRRRFPVGTHHWFQAGTHHLPITTKDALPAGTHTSALPAGQAGTHHFARNWRATGGDTQTPGTHVQIASLGPLNAKTRSGKATTRFDRSAGSPGTHHFAGEGGGDFPQSQAGTHHFARNRQGITDSGDTHIRADTLGPLIVKSRSGTPADKHPNRDHPRQPLPTTPKRFVPIRTDFC